MPTPAELLRTAVTDDPARPALTFYDDATGERVELSVATLDNWVAKTANLLVDGLGAASGGTVGLRLPCHWLAPVWLLAAWVAGQTVMLGPEADRAGVLVVGPDGVAAADASAAGEVVAVSLLPLGRPFTTPLPGRVLDYAAGVLAHGDRFVASTAPSGSDAALVDGSGTWTGAGLVERATARAAELALAQGERVLTTVAPADADGVVDTVLVPLVARTGAVLCRHLDPAGLARRVEQERVAVLGVDEPLRRV